jgi:plastocyanin
VSRLSRTAVFVASAAAVGALLYGSASRVADDRQPVTHTVTIDASTFKPSTLTIRAGDAVVWVNKDIIPHTATSEAGPFDSGTLDAGKSWRLTASRTGEFPYVCAFHPTMKGTLKVE